jgi:hypothetical protein
MGCFVDLESSEGREEKISGVGQSHRLDISCRRKASIVTGGPEDLDSHLDFEVFRSWLGRER